MPKKKKPKPYGLVAVLVFLVASFAAAQVQSFKFDTGNYSHTGLTSGACSYSGPFCVRPQQWGVYALQAYFGSFQMNSPIAKSVACVQQPHFTVSGECYQSGVTVVASPGVEKWVVVMGAPNDQCDPDHGQFQVLRLDGPAGLRWVGEVFAPGVGRTNTSPSLAGDVAYAIDSQVGDPVTYTKVDLSTLQVVASHLTSRPPWVPQTNIGGYAYTVTADPAFPQVCGAQRHFIATRGGSTPPPPTPTPTVDPPGPHPYAVYIETIYAAGITGGCGGGKFCPDRPLTRGEMAVFLVKAAQNQAKLLTLAPCVNTFNDVLCPVLP